MKTAAKKGVTSPVKWRPCQREKRKGRGGMPGNWENSGEELWNLGGLLGGIGTETEGLSLLPHNLISAGQRPFAFQYPIKGDGGGLQREAGLTRIPKIFGAHPPRPGPLFLLPFFAWPAQGIRFLSCTPSFWPALLVAQTELSHPNYYPRSWPAPHSIPQLKARTIVLHWAK